MKTVNKLFFALSILLSSFLHSMQMPSQANPGNVNWASPALAGERNVGGRTPLILATIQENSNAVQNILNAGADVEIADEQGKRALDYAVDVGNIDIATRLIHVGKANPNGRDSLLVKATQKSDRPMMLLLLAAGADPRATQIGTKKTALQVAAQSGDAFAFGVLNQEIVKARIRSLLKNQQKALQPKLILQKVPRWIQMRLIDCLKLKNPTKIAQGFFTQAMNNHAFLEAMKDPKNLQDLFKALPYKHQRIGLAEFFTDQSGNKFPFLLANSAQIEQIKNQFKDVFAKNSTMELWLKKTEDHLDALASYELVAAIESNNFEKIKQMLSNRYINLQGIYGQSALFSAIRSKNITTLWMLLQAGANPDHVFNGDKTGFIGFRAHEQRAEAERIFSSCNAATITTLLEYGANPSYILPYALAAENMEISVMLIRAGASDLGSGQTLLAQVINAKRARQTAFLLEAHAMARSVIPVDTQLSLKRKEREK